MKIKQDGNMSLINFSANGDASQDILDALFLHGVILEDDANVYGKTIRQAWEFKMSDALIRDILLGVCNEANSDMIQAFKELVLMGDGNCPECGGYMDLDDLKHDINSTKETYLCPVCGYERVETHKR